MLPIHLTEIELLNNSPLFHRISARLMPKRQPNPHRSAGCGLERQVMNKLHFFFIGYAYQVSSKTKTTA